MRIAVIADVHANLDALEAVEAAWGEVDEVWCLGDVVGYGPQPNECIAKLMALPHLAVAGNHDWAALGRIDTNDFNPDARAAAEWTAAQLSAESRAYLDALPEMQSRAPFTIVHGSPRSPIWEYLLDEGSARENFEQFQNPYCLVGHSHVPLVFVARANGRVDGRLLTPSGAFPLGAERRILNPGGVGQPRDGDARASFAILECRADGSYTFELVRVPYAIESTQSKMRAARLPRKLADRLSRGR